MVVEYRCSETMNITNYCAGVAANTLIEHTSRFVHCRGKPNVKGTYIYTSEVCDLEFATFCDLI